ncbi:uncharacterized protein LOC116166529 [Photinus pyralis]|uniref:uncharacterized protein LOC116166529 n=1 Tax=Photinus pyralis TaxID=7054 RepID=UPI0012673810|nr:uncharacterized protein LOC116166529 [Photinus pyralis]
MASKAQQLRILVAKKEQYFQRLQRLYENSRDISSSEKLNNFRVRYETLADTKTKFLDTLDEINKLEYQISEDHVPNYQVLETFDQLICHIESVAKRAIPPATASPYATGSEPQRDLVTAKTIRKLPELPLPKFNGNIKDWPLFIEIYNNMIHNNRDLNDVDRVNYLVGCLSGSALSVCSGIPPIGDNYRIILKALVDKFDDKRLIANSYIEQLLNFKQAQGETFASLNLFIETFHSAVTALRKLEIEDLADYLLSYLAFSKLNPDTQRLFENTRRKSEIPSYDDIVTFVKEQAKICARTNAPSKIPSMAASFKHASSRDCSSINKAKAPHSFVVQDNTTVKCGICKSAAHVACMCPTFLEVSPQERYQLTKTNNLCLNCLAFHKIANCKSTQSCKVCRSRHHTLLHFRSPGKNVSDSVLEKTAGKPVENHNPAEANTSISTTLNYCIADNRPLPQAIVLATAKVYVFNGDDAYREVRVLIDSCSQGNFLTLEMCRKLKLKMSKYIGLVRGIGSVNSNIIGLAQVVIGSRFDATKRYSLEVFIVDNIANTLPNSEINIDCLGYLKSLPLADDKLHIPAKVDGIIGAGLFPYLLTDTRIIGPPNLPIAVGTTLGFVVMGTAPVTAPALSPSNFCAVVEHSLDNLVERFWEFEDIPTISVAKPDDLACENIYQSTYSRDSNGRFTVALPFKYNSSNLGESRATALRRFLTLENKMIRNEEFRNKYSDIIRDYIAQGHMSKVSHSNGDSNYFIPHHAVLKSCSTSTPIRIVFDASSLRCIRQLIHDEKESLPIAAEIVQRDMYVDDLRWFPVNEVGHQFP